MGKRGVRKLRFGDRIPTVMVGYPEVFRCIAKLLPKHGGIQFTFDGYAEIVNVKGVDIRASQVDSVGD